LKTFSLLLILLLTTVSLFAKDVESLEVDELESYIQKNVIVIDIREEQEYKNTGLIPNSYKIPYVKSKNTNKMKWLMRLVKLIKEKNRVFVLVSKDGDKAKSLANELYKNKKFKNVKYLKGGIKSWINSNRRVINY